MVKTAGWLLNFLFVPLAAAFTAVGAMTVAGDLGVFKVAFFGQLVKVIAALVVAITAGTMVYLRPKLTVFHGAVVGYFYAWINLFLFNFDMVVGMVEKNWFLSLFAFLVAPFNNGAAGFIGAIVGRSMAMRIMLWPRAENFYFSRRFIYWLLLLIVVGLLGLYRGVGQNALFLDYLLFFVLGMLSTILYFRKVPAITITDHTFYYRHATTGEFVIPLKQISSIEHKHGNFLDKYGTIVINYSAGKKLKTFTFSLSDIDEPERLKGILKEWI